MRVSSVPVWILFEVVHEADDGDAAEGRRLACDGHVADFLTIHVKHRRESDVALDDAVAGRVSDDDRATHAEDDGAWKLASEGVAKGAFDGLVAIEGVVETGHGDDLPTSSAGDD